MRVLNVPWIFAVFLFFLMCGVFLIPVILYILNLQKTLRKCAPETRALEPGMVWLLLVPFVNVIFQFFVVLGMAKTLATEFRRRGTPVADPTPGQTIGLAMCICCACISVPFLGFLTLPAGLVLWIIYWIKIAEYSRALESQVQTFIPPPAV